MPSGKRTGERVFEVAIFPLTLAGAIGATALLILYPRTPLARIVGSDVAHAVPLTLVAGIGHRDCDGLQVSPSVYSTPEEVDRFCEAMESVLTRGLPG